MNMRSDKQRAVDEILANGTWMPESGFMERLSERLMKLPTTTIMDLHMIIERKVMRAAESGSDSMFIPSLDGRAD